MWRREHHTGKYQKPGDRHRAQAAWNQAEINGNNTKINLRLRNCCFKYCWVLTKHHFCFNFYSIHQKYVLLLFSFMFTKILFLIIMTSGKCHVQQCRRLLSECNVVLALSLYCIVSCRSSKKSVNLLLECHCMIQMLVFNGQSNAVKQPASSAHDIKIMRNRYELCTQLACVWFVYIAHCRRPWSLPCQL